jgi:hypothetical protein
MGIVSDLAGQILFYASLDSIMTYGLLMSVKSLLKKDGIPQEVKLSPWVGIITTYTLGIVMAFFINNTDVIRKAVFGLAIGCVSTAIYESAVKSLLNIIPTVFDKIFKK